MRTTLALVLVSSTLVLGGCKKKEAAPPAEGSGSAVKAVEGGTAPTPATDTAGSGSAVAATAEPAAGGTVPAPAATKDLLETAKADGRFTKLVGAIDAAGLGATLAGAGPFTVLAPTDEAFAKIPPKDLEALLADKAKLEALLQFHVLPGAVLAKDISTQKAIKTVQGGELPIDTASGVKLGGATVVTADIAATNGVIHVIDTVLVPAAK